ncbi:LuxR C-terminal-related transcriptional regulator [Neobacillus sp. SuZ13]|uniref:LuxR C-terminal-related transcriptional regulator n=1 Tax=Neobacillus sp. SuZ13 TaxID=3047875 RepID=UPI0024BF56BD|nr:LuxR C-terminal-related transcriptional regulator [Neobacillus sp. SuZ13]WHY67723.1 LuxR C-terminal-related transcriptional regulator [Neobacillus sp. SuZ13]
MSTNLSTQNNPENFPNRNFLLSTKFHLPHPPNQHIIRDRLYNTLNGTLQCKLTVVTAPPGYGKSTVVSDWVRDQQINACWVSLDEGDNDVLRFWAYVIASLDKIHPEVAGIYETLLQPSLMFSSEQMIINLLNRLMDIPKEVVLIFDDYHHIESFEVHQSISLLLHHLPSHIHICLISRNEPAFQIGALRAKGQINEINSNDLKFTMEELSAYWLQQTGVFPKPSVLQLLADFTEGWIAGIQLAVLSERSGQTDTLHQFNGSHRYIVDYLMEEVFQHLSDDLKLFLMKTSILHRMNSHLCDMVTDHNDSSQLLKQIEQSNFFLIPLDSQQYWYRYHHIFADFLATHLKKEMPDAYKSLHLKACHWFIQSGSIEEAIPYAITAENYELAAELILSIVSPLLRRREVTTLEKWLNQLPSPIIERPEILIVLTWTEMLAGKYENVSIFLTKVKAAFSRESHSGPILRLKEEVVVLENFNALLLGDYEGAIKILRQLAERDTMPDIKIWLDYGIELNTGELPFVRGYYGMNGRGKQSYLFHQLYHTFIKKNQYQETAYAAYQRAAFSEIHYERNQDELALEYAETAIRLARSFRLMGAYVPAVVIKSKIEWARGKSSKSFESLFRAKEYLNDLNLQFSHWGQLLTAQIVRFQLAKGEMKLVNKWAESCCFEDLTELTPNREFELLVYLLILINNRQLKDAEIFAHILLNQAEQNGRIMTSLESHLYLAEIYRGLGKGFESISHLNQALRLGEGHGYKRIFSDIGFNPKELFQQYLLVKTKRHQMELFSDVSENYLTSILQQVGINDPSKESSNRTGVHRLTAREMEVLHWLSMGLSNKEIAAKLIVTEGTVKIHLNRIYSKLGAKGRVEAIRKMEHKS